MFQTHVYNIQMYINNTNPTLMIFSSQFKTSCFDIANSKINKDSYLLNRILH